MSSGAHEQLSAGSNEPVLECQNPKANQKASQFEDIVTKMNPGDETIDAETAWMGAKRTANP